MRSLSEGRDFDDFGGLFPPNAFAANSANARVLCAETTFPRRSPRAMTAKAKSLPHEIGPIPFDIQIGLIPAVAAMLRPDSSPIHNCSRAQSLSAGIGPPLTLDLIFKAWSTPAEPWKRSWAGASHQLRPKLPEGDRGRLPPDGF